MTCCVIERTDDENALWDTLTETVYKTSRNLLISSPYSVQTHVNLLGWFKLTNEHDGASSIADQAHSACEMHSVSVFKGYWVPLVGNVLVAPNLMRSTYESNAGYCSLSNPIIMSSNCKYGHATNYWLYIMTRRWANDILPCGIGPNVESITTMNLGNCTIVQVFYKYTMCPMWVAITDEG